ncbi:MAG TPA: hypothetical protein VFE55_21440 [Acidimicrobiia bacterium]|nr:hypothetical protein [Acidimicrobiia bacterium]
MNGRRAVQAGVAAIVAGLAVAATGGGLAAAADTGYAAGFSGTASANGIRMTFDVPNTASRNPVDGGGPTAQAHVDSLGNSAAFASHPYPGELPLSGPGLLAGALKDSFPTLDAPNIPGYPFYVESKHPLAPHGEMTGPGQSLEASSDAVSSAAKAASGFGSASGSGGFVRSVATVGSTAEKVVAHAESRMTSFVLGPFRLGEVVSTAEATLRSDGSIDRDGQISVTGATVDGVPVSLGTSGLTVAGTTTPIPSSEPAAKILEQADITVELAPKKVTATSVVAPAVRIVQTFPGKNGRITYLIGAAAAALDGQAQPPLASGPIDQKPAPATPDGAASPAIPVVQPAFTVAPDQAPSSPRDLPDGPGPVTVAPGYGEIPAAAGASEPVPDTRAPAAERAPVALAQPSAATSGERVFDTSGLSLAVLAAGVVGLVISQLQRLLGVSAARATTKGKGF